MSMFPERNGEKGLTCSFSMPSPKELVSMFNSLKAEQHFAKPILSLYDEFWRRITQYSENLSNPNLTWFDDPTIYITEDKTNDLIIIYDALDVGSFTSPSGIIGKISGIFLKDSYEFHKGYIPVSVPLIYSHDTSSLQIKIQCGTQYENSQKLYSVDRINYLLKAVQEKFDFFVELKQIKKIKYELVEYQMENRNE